MADPTGRPGTREADLRNWGAILNFAATAAACVSCRGTKKRPGKEDVQRRRASRLRGFPAQGLFKKIQGEEGTCEGGEHQTKLRRGKNPWSDKYIPPRHHTLRKKMDVDRVLLGARSTQPTQIGRSALDSPAMGPCRDCP
ncbi:hypothetical protein NDU88_006837 [Pleurodeles waltl]|uniref:Uncharacterized protein n=1 Tax=Pleurodeles waltl TaxID=8319 RepID=A0AAV7QMX5_PLEWA|nr:hypothetical protein NDU88_006837 [Pleurodeles waltl]